MDQLFPHSDQALADITAQLLERSAKAGASDAVAIVSESQGASTQLRQGRILSLSREVRCAVSLTVYMGQRQGSSSSTDLSSSSLEEMVEAACAIATHTSEDPFAGLADGELMCRHPLPLDLCHPWEPVSDTLLGMARDIESGIASQADAQSDGVWVSAGQRHFWMANSRGFSGGYAASNHALSASVIATRGQVRTRDFWASRERRVDRLWPAFSVGAEAARRCVEQLQQGPVTSGSWPVLFDARSAASLLEHFVQAIGGQALCSKTSFLETRFDTPVFAHHVDITEDPFIVGGHASAPFDSDGVSGTRRALVEQGVLRGALLGTYSARRLGRRSTGNASGCHNLTFSSRLRSADDDLPAMLRRLGTGLFVTGLSGEGVRLINGDYSRAARGFWVQAGEIVHAVDGVTIAGNLLEMWQHIVAVGSDDMVNGPFTNGSILVERMRVAGQ